MLFRMIQLRSLFFRLSEDKFLLCFCIICLLKFSLQVLFLNICCVAVIHFILLSINDLSDYNEFIHNFILNFFVIFLFGGLIFLFFINVLKLQKNWRCNAILRKKFGRLYSVSFCVCLCISFKFYLTNFNVVFIFLCCS